MLLGRAEQAPPAPPPALPPRAFEPEPPEPPPIWEQITRTEAELEAEYGPGSMDQTETFGYMLRAMGWGDDGFAADLLWQGWFAEDASSQDRVSARQAWFDYTGMGGHDFSWDVWREWYGEGVKA